MPCPSLPLDVTWTTLDIQTEEDFDFDDLGRLVYQDAGNLLAEDINGTIEVFAANVGGDPSGMQMLASGNLVVAVQNDGTLLWVDGLTGASVPIFSGLIQPNGLEIGANDRIYVTEHIPNGRVLWFDHSTGDTATVGVLDRPNGVVLSPDRQTLYVTGWSNFSSGGIYAFSRTGPDTWDPDPVLFFERPGIELDAVEVDRCGNVYTSEYDTGRVIRITPDGLADIRIAELWDGTGSNILFNSMRWGRGLGGFSQDVLYVTNRNEVFGLSVGIEGPLRFAP